MSRWWWNKPSEAKFYGLVNHGATCYLNSVLQVLFMTEEFREAVNKFTSPNEEHIDHHLKELFAELRQRRVKIKYKILRALEVNNVNVQQDAAEYFERILRKTSENAAQIFHGRLSHRTTCSVCKTVTDSEGPFWHLPLDLDGGESYSVENGINMFFSPTNFDGENQMYCDNCDAKVNATRKYVITHHPDVLLLVLKRFDFSYKYMSYIKVNCIAEVPHTLKIPENQTYELYADVEHFGDLRSGHYNAIIRPKDDEWYIFDDDSVSPLDKNLFPDNAESTKSTDAYLLFYRRKNCLVRDPNPLTTQDSDKSQNEERLQEGDIRENISHLDGSAKSDCNIKRLYDKEGIKDSWLTEAKPDTRELKNGNLNDSGESALHRQKNLREEELPVQRTDDGKQTEVKRKHEAENNELSPTEDLSHYSQKTKQMKVVNIQADINSNNKQAQSVATNEQTKLKEAQRLKGKKELTGKKVKHSTDKSQCSDHKRCNNVQQKLMNQAGSNLVNYHQSSNERIDDASKKQTQESENEDEANFHQDSPYVDGNEERKLKDNQSHITGNSDRNKKHKGKKEKKGSTDGIGKDLVTQSKDRQAEEDSQAGKCVKQKTEYSENPTHPLHDEYTENERSHTGQQVLPSNYRQSELDLANTTKKNKYKIAATMTGNQGGERDEETSLESSHGYKSKELENAEASGHSSKKARKVREFPLRGVGNKKLLVKIIEESYSVTVRSERK